MLTQTQIREIAAATIKEYGIGIVQELNKGETYGGSNLSALMEIFAQKLDAAGSQDIIGVIDARLGMGWTRKLAESISALSDRP